MKKVLHLFPAYKIGGAPVNVLRFIKHSDNRVANFSAALKVDEKVFSSYQRFTKRSFDVDLSKISLASYIKLVKIIKEVKPDIIHVNGKGGAIYGFLIFPFFSGKMYYTFRGFHIKFKGIKHRIYVLFERTFAMMYMKAIAVSSSEQDLFLKTIGIEKSKIKVIGNGVEIRREALPIRISDAVKKYQFNIVSLSRIAAIKDLKTMVDALESLNDSGVGLHVMGGFLPSDMEYKKQLEQNIGNLNCKHHIYLWGDVENAGNYIHNFDLYVSTSLSEGLPTAIIEAGLSETLVIGTNCNGNIDLISDGVTGYLFSVGDYKRLGQIIREALDNYNGERQKQILASNLQQMKAFSINSHVNKILELYFTKD